MLELRNVKKTFFPGTVNDKVALKGINLTAAPYGIPELIGVAVTAALHLWRRNTLLSIAAGTVVYMVLVQFVFV